MSNNSYYEDDIAELEMQSFWQRRGYNLLSANPDCQDPDHPGCTKCEGDDNDD